MTHKIYAGFEDSPSRKPLALSLDLSKALSMVWHEGLLYKRECNVISGKLLKTMKDYLSSRKQRISLNGKNSEWANISLEVPQGLVLGLLLFLVYIDDLVQSAGCDIMLFADDTSLFPPVYDESKTAEELNWDLDKLRLWA